MATTSQTSFGNGETQQKRAGTTNPKLGEADIGLGAQERAEAIRRAISREPYTFEDKKLPVTVSVGVAQLAEGEEAEGLYERADAQLYAAKAAGRNCVRPLA